MSSDKCKPSSNKNEQNDYILQQQVRGSDNSIYECEKCGNTFGSKEEILSHILGHSEENNEMSNLSVQRSHLPIDEEQQSELDEMNATTQRHFIQNKDNLKSESTEIDDIECFLPINREENYMYVLDRRVNGSKNNVYQCRRCGKRFTGGSQRIRIHITGEKEGKQQIAMCTNPDPEVIEEIRSWKKRKYSSMKDHDTTNLGKEKSKSNESVTSSLMRQQQLQDKIAAVERQTAHMRDEMVRGALLSPVFQVLNEDQQRLLLSLQPQPQPPPQQEQHQHQTADKEHADETEMEMAVERAQERAREEGASRLQTLAAAATSLHHFQSSSSEFDDTSFEYAIIGNSTDSP